MRLAPTVAAKGWIQRHGVTFANDGLARFETGGRVGFGVAEHWHEVPPLTGDSQLLTGVLLDWSARVVARQCSAH